MTKGRRIRSEREKMGYSQTELAERVGISKQTLYKYENDIITNIPSDIIERIASVLDCTPSYIMGWAENPKENATPDLLDIEDIILSAGYEIWDDDNPHNYAIMRESHFNWDDKSPSDTITICKRDYKDNFSFEKSFTIKEINELSKQSVKRIIDSLMSDNPNKKNNQDPVLDKAIQLYNQYSNLSPEVQKIVDGILQSSQSSP